MNTMIWIWCCFLTLTALAPASQAQDSSCLNQLVPCLQYLNSTRPPPHSCCDPLRSVIKSNPWCLCSLLGSKSTTRGTGINMTKAEWLASKCGEKAKVRSCSNLGPTSGGVGMPSSASGFFIVDAMLYVVSLVTVQVLWISAC